MISETGNLSFGFLSLWIFAFRAILNRSLTASRSAVGRMAMASLDRFKIFPKIFDPQSDKPKTEVHKPKTEVHKMATIMEARTPQYDESFLVQWQGIEKQVEKITDTKIRQEAQDRFSLEKNRALRAVSNMRQNSVSYADWTIKTSEMTTKLAGILKQAESAQGRFEYEQAILAGREGMLSRVSQENVVAGAKTLAEVATCGIAGAIAGATTGARLGGPTGAAVGIALGLAIALSEE